MKNLVKDLFAVCFSYFLAYLALYVLLLIILGLFPFPLYIKNQLLDLFVPIYGIMFVMLWMKRKHIDVSCIKNPFSLNQETIKDVAAVFGINIGLTWIISLVLGLFIAVEGNIDLSELMGNSILIIIANGILAPIAEEFFFRVFLMNSLEKHGRWKAAVLISAAFALAHINPLAVISAFFISMCLFALRFKYNSIWPCAMVHICINTFNQLLDAAQIRDYTADGVLDVYVKDFSRPLAGTMIVVK